MEGISPNTDMLRSLYRDSPVAHAFLDLAARRERDRSETKVDRIWRLLVEEGQVFERREIIALFRRLEKAGCGQFVEGRRGWPSRFV
jgi:DNA-binding transcriptional regulator PaaX